MKKLTKFATGLLVVTAMTSSWKAHSGDFGAGNGGDPIAFEVEDFPKQELLLESMQIAIEALNNSAMSSEFVRATVNEIQRLDQKNKFRYVDTLILSLEEFSNLGYHGNVSLGGVTQCRLGADVIFTKQTQNYAAQRLAKVLLQEVLHHTLLTEWKCNNEVVNPLAEQILEGNVSTEVIRQIEHSMNSRRQYLLESLGPYFNGDVYSSLEQLSLGIDFQNKLENGFYAIEARFIDTLWKQQLFAMAIKTLIISGESMIPLYLEQDVLGQLELVIRADDAADLDSLAKNGESLAEIWTHWFTLTGIERDPYVINELLERSVKVFDAVSAGVEKRFANSHVRLNREKFVKVMEEAVNHYDSLGLPHMNFSSIMFRLLYSVTSD